MREDDFMRYQHKDFTSELKEQIKRTERALKEQAETLLRENKAAFAKKGIKLEDVFDQEGNDVFQPGYSSSISVGLT